MNFTNCEVCFEKSMRKILTKESTSVTCAFFINLHKCLEHGSSTGAFSTFRGPIVTVVKIGGDFTFQGRLIAVLELPILLTI